MVLDDQLRQKIDDVARRLNRVELNTAAVRILLGAGVAYCVTRFLLGLLFAGQGGLLACGAALIAGVSSGLTLRRVRHTRLSAAIFIDRKLGLEDRLGTAVEQITPAQTETEMLSLLAADAARLAPTISPPNLVPYQTPPRTNWLLVIAVLSIILSLPIYPQGLSWQLSNPQIAAVTARAEELLALADQLEQLADPALRRVARELRQVGENLKHHRVSSETAQRLLQEIDREFQQPTAANAAGDLGLDLAALQDLAHRLRTVESALPLGERISQAALSGLRSLLGREGAGTSMDNTTGGQGDNRDGAGLSGAEATDTDSEGGGSSSPDADATVTSTGQQKGSGTAGSSTNTANSPADSYGDSWADEYDSAGADEGGTGAGTGAGGNQQQPYNRQQTLAATPTPLTGTPSGSGSIFTTTGPGTSLPQGGQPSAPGSATTIYSSGLEGAVDQESIPSAYRRWVKLYFAALEASASAR